MRLAGVCLVAVASFAACERRDAPLTLVSPSPVASLTAPASERIGPMANWRGDATVVSRSGEAGCGWGTNVGDRRSAVDWRVTIAGESIILDEDMSNWPTDDIPFSGSLQGVEFTARYYQGDDYARWVCQFREATLVGRFSPDFSSFEALETVVWGVPERQTVVQRRWIASRM